MGRTRRQQRAARPVLVVGQVYIGIVVKLKADGRYGFIRPVNGAANIYFRLSDVSVSRQATLHPGSRVQFQAAPGRGKSHRERFVAHDIT